MTEKNARPNRPSFLQQPVTKSPIGILLLVILVGLIAYGVFAYVQEGQRQQGLGDTGQDSYCNLPFAANDPECE